MPIDLQRMLHPSRTAVLTMEVQRDVVGDLSVIPPLQEAVKTTGILEQIRDLLAGARRAGVPVIHCVVDSEQVPWAPPNYPGAAAVARGHAGRPPDPGRAEPVPEIGAAASDIVVSRRQGVSPFTGTELDTTLRRLGVQAVVACGVSLNVGVLGLVIEAVGFGFQVAVATDAVVGVPVEYGRAVLANSIPFVATPLSVGELVGLWPAAGGATRL